MKKFSPKKDLFRFKVFDDMLRHFVCNSGGHGANNIKEI